MVERDLSLAAYEEQPLHLLHLSARESVDALRAAQAKGVAATAEVTPHHLCLTDEAVRSLDSNVKMNPPLRSADDRAALIEGLRRRHDRLGRHRPRPARAAREGGAVRGGAFRRHRPRDRLRGALHQPRRAGAPPAGDRCSSACRPGRRAPTGSSRRGSRSAPRPTSSSWTPLRLGASRKRASARVPRTRGFSASTLRGRVRADRGRGTNGVRGVIVAETQLDERTERYAREVAAAINSVASVREAFALGSAARRRLRPRDERPRPRRGRGRAARGVSNRSFVRKLRELAAPGRDLELVALRGRHASRPTSS